MCRQSEGNAVLLGAIVQDMTKTGSIVHDDEEWRLTRPLETIDPGVPQSLQQMLEVQFERLNAPEQRVLEAGSVVGEHFSVWAIANALAEKIDHIQHLSYELPAPHQ